MPIEPGSVLVIGDSTLLAIEYYDTLAGLRGFDMVFDAASCRTIGIPSCGDEPQPPNAVDVIATTEGDFTTVIVMAGYDEWWTSFPASAERAIDTARGRGVSTVVFLRFREGVGYIAPDGQPASAAFERNNDTLQAMIDSGDFPELVLADWYGYTSRPEAEKWVTRDGIHLTKIGSWALGDYLSRWVAHLHRQPCPTPTPETSMADGTCANPDDVPTPPADQLEQ